MTVPFVLVRMTDGWASFYDAHKVVSVTIRYLHLAGLVVGGGTALAADRGAIRAARTGAAERAAVIANLAGSHRIVVPSLAVVVATGVLMTAADASTFLASPLFWTKIGLVSLLLINGGALVAAESAVTRGRNVRAWAWLAATSGLSLALWLLTLLVGTWLTVAA